MTKEQLRFKIYYLENKRMRNIGLTIEEHLLLKGYKETLKQLENE